ncbi:MAG: OmpH family outer membrane protein [Candidatus Eisenbacteria sp.]|nr:OmpH family outer membrane protein [Candidatus Eisenbacteria bacterium]
MDRFRMRVMQAGLGLAGVLLVALVFPHGILAADIKMGYIDSVRLLAEYGVADEAQQTLDKELKAWEEEAEQMHGEIMSMANELESQRLMLSEAKLQERDAELRQRQMDYERFVQSIWGQDGKAVQRNVELTRPIIEKINEILARIGEEEDFDIIFDAANGSIAYGKASLDMTERVLEELNKELE